MKVDFAFLDSGTGGLPYMMYLRRKYPDAKCVYLADTKNFPYGTKTRDEVIQNASECVKLLIARFNPTAIVVACNTMSVIALETLRKLYAVPFVGTVPAIKLAASKTTNHRIGLLATDRTVEDDYTKKLIKDFASDCKVFSRGDAALIDFIEKKLISATLEERLAAIEPSISYFNKCNVDTIVLACTHFTNMTEDFALAAGSSVKIIDSRDGVARQAMILKTESVQNGGKTNCTSAPFKSDSPESDLFKANPENYDLDNLTGSPLFVTSVECKDEYGMIARKLQIPFAGLLE